VDEGLRRLAARLHARWYAGRLARVAGDDGVLRFPAA